MTHSRFVWLAILLTSPVLVLTRGPDYTIVKLDTPSGFVVGAPSAINARGRIVGSVGGNAPRAVVWEDMKVIAWDMPPGGSSNAVDINNRGQVVGSGGLWQDATLIDGPGIELGAGMAPAGINESGQIVGLIPTAIAGEFHAALWQNGAIVDLGVLPGDSASGAAAINNGGQIVGASEGTASQVHAFIWDKGKMTELPGLNGQEGPSTQALDINNRGQVVGNSGPQPVMWEKGIPIPLDTLPPLTIGKATAINDNGDIVGFLRSPTSSFSVPVLWQNGKPVTLPMLPTEPDHPNDYIATDINNSGTIIGYHLITGFPLPLMWVRNAH
ncbi:MAG TPA: hypothetical protein VKB50_11950 [Vicinamibacterales bacterium]|nr:hypothetical protein [Vicinamibacterales bacterium]